MRLFLIRAAAYGLSAIWTAGYALLLLSATWLYCYGTHPLCAAGWWPRTTITAAYLIVLGGVLILTRWAVRSTEQKEA